MKHFMAILIIIININTNESTYCYEYSPRCFCEFENTLLCDNFMSLNDLNFDRYLNLKLKYIHLKPIQPITFDSYIYFNFLNFDDNLEVTLSNFNGFDLLVNPFDGLIDPTKNITLFLNNSRLNFYYSKQLIETSLCNQNYFNSNFRPLFSAFNRIYLDSTINYPRRICPLLFQNSNIKQLVTYQITDSNRLNFIDSTDYENVKFNIEQLDIYNSRISLNSVFLNRYLFGQVRNINTYNTSIISFESGLLKNFHFLNKIQFEIFNFYQFIKRFKYDQTNWLLDLNTDLYEVNLIDTNENIIKTYGNKQIKVILSDPNLQYEYPDSDFCLFRKFPSNKMIYPVIKTKPNLTCSCTLVWLLQYVDTYKDRNDLVTTSVGQCLNRTDFKQILVACDFSQRIQVCENKEYLFVSKSSKLLHSSILVTMSFIYSLLI